MGVKLYIQIQMKWKKWMNNIIIEKKIFFPLSFYINLNQFYIKNMF